MPVLNQASGGGPPEHQLNGTEFEALASALGVKFGSSTKARVQHALDRVLELSSLEFNHDARPIMVYYKKAAHLFDKLTHHLEDGLKNEAPDVSWMAKYAFDSARRDKSSDPDLFRLKMLSRFARENFERAKANLLERHTLPTPKGRKPPSGLNVLIWIMAEFAESVGVTPSAAYNDVEGNRDTRFVKFIDLLREYLGDKLPGPNTKTTSAVRAILTKRKERRKSGKLKAVTTRNRRSPPSSLKRPRRRNSQE